MKSKITNIIRMIILGTILIWITGCGAPLYMFSSNKSDTYNTSETNTDKIYKSAVRTAGEMGLKVTSSDKAGGTFMADKQGIMNIVRLNFLLLDNSSNSDLSFILNTKASLGGRSTNRKFANILQNYIPLNTHVSSGKMSNVNNNPSVKQSNQPSENISAVFAQGALPKKGDLFVGGRLGLGSLGAGVGFGANFEMITQEDFLNLGDIPASLGLGATVGYSTYRTGWFGYHWRYTNIAILVNAVYHADVLQNEKLDTFVKFGLGYNAGSVKFDGVGGYSGSSPTHGGVLVGSSVGARYFLSDALALVAELGLGFAWLQLGVDVVL